MFPVRPPSKFKLEVMTCLYKYLGNYKKPKEISHETGIMKPVVRRILSELLEENYVRAKKTKKGNEYKTYAYKMQYFLDDYKEEIQKRKELIINA